MKALGIDVEPSLETLQLSLNYMTKSLFSSLTQQNYEEVCRQFFTVTAGITVTGKYEWPAADFVKHSAGKSIFVGDGKSCTVVESTAVLLTSLTFIDGHRKKTEVVEIAFLLEGDRLKIDKMLIK